VQQGSGENGKTTFAGAVAAALGDYYTLVPDRVILGNPSDHPTELMTLRGARFALIEETPEARRLSVNRLKKVVGTPQITARLIRQDSVTFDAVHSLFLSTNYRPVIEEVDHGTWRRLAQLRFP
jgi:putative DNA primase/helicase